MKLILSRKGLDSGAGGMPSAILPDGQLVPMPIPESAGTRRLPTYNDLSLDGHNIGALAASLSRGRLSGTETVHLDPDLLPHFRSRPAGWMPAFGQAGAAERHLRNSGVDGGDLFIFFGWFRQTRWRSDGALEFAPGAPDLHVLYGWLLIDRRVPLDMFATMPPWMSEHPHSTELPYDSLDSIYFSSRELALSTRSVPGAGFFRTLSPELVLTERGRSRSRWLLVDDFLPRGRPPLTYHADPHRWDMRNDGTGTVGLRAVSRGQEFVLDLDEYPGVAKWIARLFRHENWRK